MTHTDKPQEKQNVIILFFKKSFTRLLKIRGNPREIALGFALGLFVGMTPLMGFHTPIAVFFAALFKWNKISSAVGVWVSNPLTAPVIYGINYFIGAKIMGSTIASGPTEHAKATLINLLHSTPEIMIAMTIGGIVTGIPLAVTGYYFSFSAVSKYQEDIKKKLVKQKEKRAINKIEKKRLKKRLKNKVTVHEQEM